MAPIPLWAREISDPVAKQESFALQDEANLLITAVPNRSATLKSNTDTSKNFSLKNNSRAHHVIDFTSGLVESTVKYLPLVGAIALASKIKLGKEVEEIAERALGTTSPSTIKLGEKFANLEWEGEDNQLVKLEVGQAKFFRDNGLFYSAESGKPFAKNISLSEQGLLLIEPINLKYLFHDSSFSRRDVSSILLHSDGTMTTTYKDELSLFSENHNPEDSGKLAFKSFIQELRSTNNSLRVDKDGVKVYCDSNLYQTISAEHFGSQRAQLEHSIASRMDESAKRTFLHDIDLLEKRLGASFESRNLAIAESNSDDRSAKTESDMTEFAKTEFAKTQPKNSQPLESELSKTQLANIYYQINRRIILARQFMQQAADPSLISQGKYSTCNVTAGVQVREFTNDPARAAQLITSIAIKGGFVTSDGHIIDMTSIPGGLQPFGESLKTLKETGPIYIAGQRNYLGQLYQNATVNAYWQSTTLGPDKVIVEEASTINELRYGKEFHPGSARYGFDPNDKPIMAHVNSDGYRAFTRLEQNKRLDPLTQSEKLSYEATPIRAPDMTNAEIIEAGRLMSNSNHGFPYYLYRLGKEGDLGYLDSAAITSENELTRALLAMKQNQAFPAVVEVNSGLIESNARSNAISTARSTARSTAHVINVLDVRETEAGSGAYVADVSDPRGLTSGNHIDQKVLSIDKLYELME
jgi:hypothetical protein